MLVVRFNVTWLVRYYLSCGIVGHARYHKLVVSYFQPRNYEFMELSIIFTVSDSLQFINSLAIVYTAMVAPTQTRPIAGRHRRV